MFESFYVTHIGYIKASCIIVNVIQGTDKICSVAQGILEPGQALTIDLESTQ
jgi:hypothetical protein